MIPILSWLLSSLTTQPLLGPNVDPIITIEMSTYYSLSHELNILLENILEIVFKNVNCCLLREEFKVRKKKKCGIFHTRVRDPPPPSVEKYNLFFLSFWQHSEQLWKKLFFPLEKTQKHLENFHKSFLVEG